MKSTKSATHTARDSNLRKKGALERSSVKSKRTGEKFISGIDFDFNKSISSPYLESPSTVGPMTRYDNYCILTKILVDYVLILKGRAGLNFGFTLCDVDFRSRRLRRTSIYSRPVVESHMHDSYHSSREEKISNTQISSTKSCLKDTRLGNRKSDKRSRNNNAEQNVTLKYPNDGLCKTSDLQNISNDFDSENALSLDKTKIKMQVMTPHTRRRAQLATVRRSSLSSSIALKKVAPCTPQPPSDPTVVLKKKIKIKMDAQIEYKVAHMPPSTPYALIIDSTKVSAYPKGAEN